MDARHIWVRGIVQGVGFRPFVYRLARAKGLSGWVLNQEDGVEIHVEGGTSALAGFITALSTDAPPAAQIVDIEVMETEVAAARDFVICDSYCAGSPSVRISPDLPICEACLAELFDPADPRYLYPYINCTNCGPRFTVIKSLPYDRKFTTMRRWAMDQNCAAQYSDPYDRRFHAQPLACPRCGPNYFLESSGAKVADDQRSVQAAARFLCEGRIVAVKGIGGYHLSCDANNGVAVENLRERKFRKEKPFAVMIRSIETARRIVELTGASEKLLCSSARPVVLARARIELAGVAPGNHELGVMLPYAPIHHMLFAFGAPEMLVMTSANRSSEPIAYRDEEARQQLSGLADFFLMGERPIARRVDDSVARAGVLGPMILRRSRGYAPGAVTNLPSREPILAVGADLKNSITLVVEGQAFVSQHIGDLDHYEAFAAFQETIADFLQMYAVDSEDLTIAHDAHPEYVSSQHAVQLAAKSYHAVQHHLAHVASVMAEKSAWERPAVGVSFDGTGYGDDGTIWGGEFFVGSMIQGWDRMVHLRPALLPGGDAAARFPVQCAAGFLAEIDRVPNMLAPPFNFPKRYLSARELLQKKVRTFTTSSMGRLFDSVAALLGFTREISFEGQAAIWLEQLARTSCATQPYPFPTSDETLDFRPVLTSILDDRRRGTNPADIARRFHIGVASATAATIERLAETNSIDLVVLSGGVFQNELLLSALNVLLQNRGLAVWTNSAVPPNDGGISLGQAACAALRAAKQPANSSSQERNFL